MGGGGIQTTIDTFLDILELHAPPHVEEHMSESHVRRRLGIFGRRMKSHAPLETRMGMETNGPCADSNQ